MAGEQIDVGADPAHFAWLEDRLYEYNVQATGIDDGDWLSVLVRDDDGGIVAGLGGTTWGGTLEVRQLWVHASHRGSGLGSTVLRAAEAEARRRGCTQAVLNTYDFQAPAFYARHGYEHIATVEDYPRGHRGFTLRKSLVQSDGA